MCVILVGVERIAISATHLLRRYQLLSVSVNLATLDPNVNSQHVVVHVTSTKHAMESRVYVNVLDRG